MHAFFTYKMHALMHAFLRKVSSDYFNVKQGEKDVKVITFKLSNVLIVM